MKKIISVFVLMLFTIPMVIAQEDEPEVSAGITPDSPLYGIDVWWDNLRANTATSNVEKARIRLEIAEERVAEMKAMANENRLEAMARAQEEQEKQINEVVNISKGLSDEHRIFIQERLQKHILTLERVRELVPEQAQKGIDNAITNSKKSFELNQARISLENRVSVQEIKQRITEGKIQIRGKLTEK